MSPQTLEEGKALRRLTIDFETRATADLKKCGAWKYAEHEETEVLCLALKWHGETPMLWLPEKFRIMAELQGLKYLGEYRIISDEELRQILADADEIEAHNMMFERAVWHHVMYRRHGFPDLPAAKLRCSASKAAVHSIPRPLEQACKAMGLPIEKDMEGHRLMMQMCKPRKTRKVEREQYPKYADMVFWHETPEQLQRLFIYCCRDTLAEEALSDSLDELCPQELVVWQLDQEINARGVFCDTETVKTMELMCAEYKEEVSKEFHDCIGIAPTQVAKVIEELKDNFNVSLDNLQKATVEEAIVALHEYKDCDEIERLMALDKQHLNDRDKSKVARRLLEIRRDTQKTSIRKLPSMLNMASAQDQRIRDLLMYHGASTGRWSGKGMQPQNFPRGNFKMHEVEKCIEMVLARQWGEIEATFGVNPITAASYCLRAMLRAAPGNVLYCSDFASVEGRVRSWLAEEEDDLRDYRAGKDLYKVSAALIYPESYEEITKKQRNTGKPIDLGLGYQGGIGAFLTFAKISHVDLEELAEIVFPLADDEMMARAKVSATTFLKRNSDSDLSMDAATACDIVKQIWRLKHVKTVKFWYKLEEMCVKAINNPRRIYKYNHLRFLSSGKTCKNEDCEWNGAKLTETKRCPLCGGKDIDPGFMYIELPSGRTLYYRAPELRQSASVYDPEEEKWVRIKLDEAETYEKAGYRVWIREQVSYMGVDSQTRKWLRIRTYGGKLCENCFGSGTYIVTSKGLKPIQNITKKDKIFDGVDFVTCDGAINNGEQETIKWLEEEVTADHLILTNGNSWTSTTNVDVCALRRSLLKGLVSAISRSYPETIKKLHAAVSAEENSTLTRDLCGGEKNAADLADILREELEERYGKTISQPSLSIACGRTDTQEWSADATTQNALSTETMELGASRSAKNGSVTGMLFSNMQKLFPDGMSSGLTWTELIMKRVMNLETSVLSAEPKTLGIGETPGTFATLGKELASWISTTPTAPDGKAVILLLAILRMAVASSGSSRGTTKQSVYDILNCGPRNRYVVMTALGPVIAHNCTSAIARDLMAYSMVNLDNAGYSPILTVHDEILSETPEDFGSLGEFTSIMEQTPEWADGCPVKAESWKGDRYRK